jgi:hypothetical protein
MSHTPGPWYAEEADAAVPVCSESDGRLVAYVDYTKVRTDAAEYAANARLIAAAPELLEALRVAANLLTLYLPEEEIVGTAFKTKEARERIHAAIAKATGGNS